MTKYWTPPTFFTQIFFYQNDSEWPKMDFKHNFKKYGILSVRKSLNIEQIILIEIVSSHEWHLNFSPKLHQWRLSNGLEALAEGHLRVWTDAIWGEKFKCHECTEQFLINTIKYWQNPFHLEEGKSQISQVWKKTSQFDRRQISNNTGFEKINLFYAT